MEKRSTHLSVTFPTLVGDAGLETTAVKAVADAVILWLWVLQWVQTCGRFRYQFWYHMYQTILGTTNMNA